MSLNIINIIRSILFRFKCKKCGKNIKILGKVYIWSNNLTIGDNVTVFPGTTFWGKGNIIIGNNTAIGKDTIVFSNDEIKIGNDVLIAAQSYIIDSDHEFKKSKLIREQGLNSEKIYIGNDVWIGAGVKILKGSFIEDNAIVGAMSLVNSRIESGSISFGIPAKHVKYRNQKMDKEKYVLTKARGTTYSKELISSCFLAQREEERRK